MTGPTKLGRCWKAQQIHSSHAIAALDARKKDIAAQKRDVAKQLKNEQQKRRRHMAKARNLSTEDLLNVVVTRATIAKAKAKAKASA